MGGVEGFSVVKLQMCGQCEHEKPIYSRDGKWICFVGEAGTAEFIKLLYSGGRGAHILVHVDAEPQVTQQKQGFLRAYKMGVLQQRHCTRDFVVEDVGLSGEELFSCGIFVFDYFGDDSVFKLGDYVGLGDAECHLIGNLVEVTCGF